MDKILMCAYCANCDKINKYWVLHHISCFSIHDIGLTYIEQTPYCKECNKEVYVPEINDINCEAREKEYYKKIHFLKGEN